MLDTKLLFNLRIDVMEIVKFDGIKKDRYQLVRLNNFLTHLLQLISEVDAKIQSYEYECVERNALEVDKKFFLEEYSKKKEELDFMLHVLGLDKRGDWKLWKGKLRRVFRVISGNTGVKCVVVKKNKNCFSLV